MDVIAQFEIYEDVPNRMVGAGNKQLASFLAGNKLLKNTKDLLLIFVICPLLSHWDRFEHANNYDKF